MSWICESCMGQARIRDPFTLLEDECPGCGGDPHMIKWDQIGWLGINLPPAPDPMSMEAWARDTDQAMARLLGTTGLTMADALAAAGAVANMLRTTWEEIKSWAMTILQWDHPLQEERERRIRKISHRKNRSQTRSWSKWKKRRR